MKNRTFHLIFILFLMIPSFVYGQEDIDSLSIVVVMTTEDSLGTDIILDFFPDAAIPEFPGGEDSLFAYLKRMIIYPDSAKALKISGTVYISFVVEADGSISRVKLIKGIGGGCDEAAFEAVRNMPKWKPEEGKGGSYAATMHLPIKFVLDKTETTDSLQY